MKINYDVMFKGRPLDELGWGATFVLAEDPTNLYMVIESPEDAGIEVKEDEVAVFELEEGYIDCLRKDTPVIRVIAEVTLKTC